MTQGYDTAGPLEARDLLFGDLPVAFWPSGPETPEAEPWLSFAQAREHLAGGEAGTAIERYQSVLSTPELESRHYLQAWHFLRQAGVRPDEGIAKQVLGMVIEVAVEDGLVVVAAYADGTARYYHQSGGGVVWEKPDDSLQPQIDALLQSGQGVAQIIGPWDGPLPLPAPETGEARITMLTPSGRHFGQAQYEALANDPVGGPPMAFGFALLESLLAKTEQPPA